MSSISNNYLNDNCRRSFILSVLFKLINTVDGFKVKYFAKSVTTKANYLNIHQLHSILILSYTKNGDKYSGQWADSYKGQGEVNYKVGTRYKGRWEWFEGYYKRDGLGTLYYADRQVFNQGKWDQDEILGKE